MKVSQPLLALLVGLAFTACSSPALSHPPQATSSAPPAAPTPSAAPPTDPDLPVAGGTAILGILREPGTLNPLQTSSPLEDMISAFMVEGLVGIDADGNYAPVLAESLPTVSADGLTLTYPLKKEVRWSNGEAFTCADVQFTLTAILSAPSRFSLAGYRDIESLDCPETYSAVVTLTRSYAPYLRLFSVILPASTGNPAKMDTWDYNRAPISSGPWILKEWQAGASITLARNPYYREAGKPYLENIVLRILPNRQAGIKLLGAGEITMLWDLDESDLPALQDLPGVAWRGAPSGAGENELLVFNLGPGDGSAPANSSNTPHPILSDLRVRQAIQYAIDKQRLVDSLPSGSVRIGSAALPDGPFACPQPVSLFDPAQARALLDEAGWKPGADGIRTKEDARLSLRISATTGNPLRLQSEQTLIEMLRAVGIELTADNLPEGAFFASWDADGLRKKGRFDILMYTTGSDTDPDGYLFGNYHSLRIPSEANDGLGSNFSRYTNAKIDEWLDEAAATPDMAARRALYCKVSAQIAQDLPRVFLYERFALSGYREALQNFRISPGPAAFAAASQDWWLKAQPPDGETSAPTYLIASRAATPTPAPTDPEPQPLIPPPASLLPQFGGMFIGLILIVGAALLVKFMQSRR